MGSAADAGPHGPGRGRAAADRHAVPRQRHLRRARDGRLNARAPEGRGRRRWGLHGLGPEEQLRRPDRDRYARPVGRAATIEVELAEPAMLFVQVTPPAGAGRDRGLALGAAVAPTKIRPADERPADFDEFW